MDSLIALIRGAERLVIFTGAGVSTLSGIRDYRGRNGIYRELGSERIFDIEEFRRNPAYYYERSRDFIYNLDEKEPSLVHRECARLEQLGKVRALITQNIDQLHRRAGSRQVIELHGSPRIHRCLECDMEYPYRWAAAEVNAGRVPRCGHCGGLCKPDITFFGEMLPEGALAAATAAAGEADVMLVLGSSLLVHPAASIPLHTCRLGGKLAIVNDGETPLDNLAVCRQNDLQAVFERVAREIV